MKSILISTIPHHAHRKAAGETVGDWYEDNIIIDDMRGSIKEEYYAEIVDVIKVSKMSNVYYEFLVSLHEFVEMKLCEFAGVTEQQVDKFDESWKEHDNIEEPGNDPNAPYNCQHRIADVIERLVAIELGVDWNAYEEALEKILKG
jgi:hypothetical protein